MALQNPTALPLPSVPRRVLDFTADWKSKFKLRRTFSTEPIMLSQHDAVQPTPIELYQVRTKGIGVSNIVYSWMKPCD